MPPKQLVLKHDPSILLETLHEDDDVLAIAKPFGVLAHPSPGFWTKGTLAHALVGRVANDMMQERGNHNESLPFCFKLNHAIFFECFQDVCANQNVSFFCGMSMSDIQGGTVSFHVALCIVWTPEQRV